MTRALVRLVLPDVQDLLREGTADDVAAALAPFHPADVAELIGQLDDEQAAQLVLGLEPQKRTDVFELLEVPLAARLLERIGPKELAPTVAAMASDDRADLVAALPDALEAQVMAAMPAEDREEALELAGYPEGTAGAIMTADYVHLSPDETARDAIEHIRQVARKRETIYATYVVDQDERLLGAVSLETLILAPPDETLREIMIPPIYGKVDDDQEAVVEKLRHYDFLALPIVDAAGIMQGIVTYDDAYDVAEEEATEDAHLMGGVSPLPAPYFETSLPNIVRARALWLSILFFTELFGGSILRQFEHTLERVVALVFFLPLIIASGGNSGAQSATLVIRGLAVGDVEPKDVWRIVRRELASGLTLGALLGLYGIGVATLWGLDDAPKIAVVVLVTLVAVVVGGSLLGSLMPLLMVRLKIDPAITSSPLVTCLVDVLGILVYVLVAGAVFPPPA